MNSLLKILISTFLVFLLAACGDTESQAEESHEKNEEGMHIKETAEQEDAQLNHVVTVNDFNKDAPFFSTAEETDIEWKTISQDDESEKMFQYNASTVFSVDDKIIRSKVVDDNIIVKHGIHTGMLRDEFEAHFKGLKNNDTPTEDQPIVKITPDQIYFSCCTEETQYWKFRFVDDTLYEITYFQYYD